MECDCYQICTHIEIYMKFYIWALVNRTYTQISWIYKVFKFGINWVNCNRTHTILGVLEKCAL